MEITVKRTEHENSTTGAFFINDVLQCVSLEDKCRGENQPKIYGETAIPYGRYRVTLRKEGSIYWDYKTRFADIKNERGTLWVRDIPGFEYVLIHVGNYLKDTLGCLLVGSRIVSDTEIAESTKAYKKIYPIIAGALERGEEVYINYVKA